MGFSRQEYWSGLPWTPPGDLSNPRVKPRFPALQANSLLSEPPGKPKNTGMGSLSLLQGIFLTQKFNQGLLNCFPGGSDGKASACNAGDPGSIPGSGRSSGEGNGNPFQHSCLENPMDGGAWLATVHGVAKSRTQLSDFTSPELQVDSLLAELPGKPRYSTYR